VSGLSLRSAHPTVLAVLDAHDADPGDGAPSEFLSREQCKALFERVVAMTTGGGHTNAYFESKYSGTATWARNRVYLSASVKGLILELFRGINGAYGAARTTRVDQDGLNQAVRRAESALIWNSESAEQMRETKLDEPILSPTLWSANTYACDGAARGSLAQRLIRPAEEAGVWSAGELLIAGRGYAVLGTNIVSRYYPVTAVECSMTVRNPKGTGSGWAGMTHYDIARVDPAALAAVALDKCLRSANPSALEPGRYTAILEPQAVSDLLAPLLGRNAVPMDRGHAEFGFGPFAYKPGQSKIGQRILDPRISLRSDPMDPEAGFIPFERTEGAPYQAVSWVADGYLRDLWYRRDYALAMLNKPQPLFLQGSYRLSSNVAPVSMDDMIRSTRRGIVVTRFSNVMLVDEASMLCTGFTRDGLWLVENGAITKPIKNFRFTESPLFVLNKVDAIGAPVRVFDQDYARVVPPIKVNDFSFTSLADAV